MKKNRWTALQLSKKMSQKEIKVTEAVESVFSVMEEREKELHAFLYYEKEKTMQQAERIQQKLHQGESVSPFMGIPIAVKDNICTKGMPTTCGSNMLQSFVPYYDATVIEKLKNAGMLLLGKTNMDEFAFGSTTETSAFGSTRNPHNPDYVPGGSSGGSAAAVASGECPAALGTDTGGSVRQPAAHCGIVGLKPTYGSISRYGMVAYGSSLEQIGPMTAKVEDCKALFHLIRGKDVRDATTVDYDKRQRDRAKMETTAWQQDSNLGERSLSGRKIGIPLEFMDTSVSSSVRKNIEKAIKIWEQAGAVTEYCRLRYTDYYVPVYYTIASAEASSNLERFDGVTYGYSTGLTGKSIHDWCCENRSQGFGQEVKRRIMLGTFVLSAGYYEDYYLQSCKVRRLITEDWKGLFQRYDVVVTPVVSRTAPRLGEALQNPIKTYQSDQYTISANLTGMPAISLPCGADEKGLPTGVQLTADYFQEDMLFQFGRVLEQEG